jgi:hypothetical protein
LTGADPHKRPRVSSRNRTRLLLAGKANRYWVHQSIQLLSASGVPERFMFHLDGRCPAAHRRIKG